MKACTRLSLTNIFEMMKIVSRYLLPITVLCFTFITSKGQDMSMVVPNYEFKGELDHMQLVSGKSAPKGALESFKVADVSVLCNNGDFRITNITNIRNELYMGGLCNGGLVGNKEDLVVYVLKIENEGIKHKGKVLASFPLNFKENQMQSGEWLPWNFDTDKRQPVLLFIYFDQMENLVMGVSDRQWTKRIAEEDNDEIGDFTSTELDGIDVVYWEPNTKLGRLANAWEKSKSIKEFMGKNELKILEKGSSLNR